MNSSQPVALITGAANGIGKATAALFAEKGYAVLVGDLDGPGVTGVAEEIVAQGGRAVPVAIDITDPAGCDAMVELAISEFGKLDAAVNNAGVPQKLSFEGADSSMIHEMSDAEWQRVIDINLSGTFYCLRAEMRSMVERGEGGAIVNLSSSSAVLALEGMASYVASKKGIFGLTEVAALEGGRHQIRVNTVIPAQVVGTKMWDETMGGGAEGERVFGANSPLERPGRPIDIANACYWACSEESSYLSGTSLLIDGAATIRHPSSRKRV